VDELSLAEWVTVLDELAAMGTLFLTVTGGDPLVRADLMEFLSEARRRRFSVTLKTAGQGMGPREANRLAALVNFCDVSLHGSAPATADRFTGRSGSHARTTSAIRSLVEAGVRTTVCFSATNANLADMEAVGAWSAELGARFRLGVGLMACDEGDTSPLQWALSPEERVEVLFRLEKRRPPVGQSGTSQTDSPPPHPDVALAPCGIARSTVAIGPTGTVHACLMHPVVAGHVRDGLANVWRESPVLHDIRAITRRTIDDGPCAGCGYRSSCSYCMAQSMSERKSNLACSSWSYLGAQTSRIRRARPGDPDPAPPRDPPPAAVRLMQEYASRGPPRS
jgi:radical SAM protein with 4Fe4S-binding SPASM domain